MHNKKQNLTPTERKLKPYFFSKPVEDTSPPAMIGFPFQMERKPLDHYYFFEWTGTVISIQTRQDRGSTFISDCVGRTASQET